MRAALSVLVFLASFLAVNRLVVRAVPLPVETGLRAKVVFAEQHLDAYDAFFLGSSATLYGIRPETFEDELARSGHPGMRVCNLGVGGMGSFEGAKVLRDVLAHAGERLAYVFYEEPLFDALLWYPEIVNPRYVHWHDTRSTLDAIDALRFAPGPPEYKREAYVSHWLNRGPAWLPDAARGWVGEVTGGGWRRANAWEHVRLWARRESAIAEGAGIATAFLGRDDVWPTEARMAERRGWMDIADDPDPGAQRQHERFVADAAGWQATLQGLRDAEGQRPAIEGNYDVDSLRDALAEIRRTGAEPIVFVAPRTTPSPMMNALEDAGEIPVLFQFNAPTRYPELDDMSLRWDPNHLNERGAKTWSRLFARRFARYLDESGRTALRTPGPPETR
ncbi:MAG: hypothetical protein AAGB93_00795 [Planctomycetota bacterium]